MFKVMGTKRARESGDVILYTLALMTLALLAAALIGYAFTLIEERYDNSQSRLQETKQNLSFNNKLSNDEFDVQCDDIEKQVLNAYRLSIYMEEYQTQNPLEYVKEFSIHPKNKITTEEESGFTQTNNFRRTMEAMSCYSIKYKPTGKKSHKILMKDASQRMKESWGIIYDSTNKEDRKQLLELVSNNTI